jgi:glutathione S-transferase
MESNCLNRFVAKQFQLAGKDDLEQAKVDVVVDTIADANAEFVPIRWGEDETKKEAAIKQFFAEALQKHLKNLEVLAKEYSNGGPFFVGNKLTWADLLVYDILEGLLQIDNSILDKYSWLQRNCEEVAKQPKIATYLKNRPDTEF